MTSVHQTDVMLNKNPMCKIGPWGTQVHPPEFIDHCLVS
jgi:hypothetical protein